MRIVKQTEGRVKVNFTADEVCKALALVAVANGVVIPKDINCDIRVRSNRADMATLEIKW